MKPLDIIFFGAILVVVGGIIGAVGTWMQNKASSAKSDRQLTKIQDLNDQNLILSSSIADLSGQNSELSKNITTLSEQNADLLTQLSIARNDVNSARLEALDNTFGSMDGYVVEGSSGFLKLYNNSKLPMYDVQVFITNYDMLLLCKVHKDQYGHIALEKQCYQAATKSYKVPIAYGESVVDFSDFFINKQGEYKFLAKVITKKGTFYQQQISSSEFGTAFRILVQERPGEYWKQYIPNADGIKTDIKEETFKVELERNFRRGDVDWDKEFPLPVSFSII